MLIRIWVKSLFLLTFVVYTNGYAKPNYNTTMRITKRVVYRGGTIFEAPHWSQDENSLYWVDQLQQRIYRLDGYTGNIAFKQIEYGPVSLVVRVKDYPELLLVTVRSELYLLPWNATQGDSDLRLLSAVDLGKPDNRCNDGKVDANGRLWFGTTGKVFYEQSTAVRDQASVYTLDQYNYKEPEIKIRPVSVSNGIAWTSDNKFMFYIDTLTQNVDVFDFDLYTGTIRNRRTIFSFQANNVSGLPDGMTIDTDNNLWVACNGGGMVVKIDGRTGRLLGKVTLPTSVVLSLAWGGSDLSTLYVTTGTVGLTAEELAQQPEAGSLFAIDGTGSRGYPSNQFVFQNADMY